MNERVTVSKQGRVLRISLNRPDKKNALTLAMYEALTEAVLRAEHDNDLRVVLVTGAGGNFTTGNDLAHFPPGPSTDAPTPVMRLLETVIGASVPIVAAVDGVAAGIGATLLLHLDAVVMARDAKLLYPFINLALVPEAGSSLLLVQQLGYTRAADLLMQGRPIDGERAFELGLASTLASPGGAQAEGERVAAALATRSGQALRSTKRLLKGDTTTLMARILEEERLLFAAMETADHAEAVAAFRDKRQPVF